MRKALVLLLAGMFVFACSSVNKRTLSYKLSKVNGEKYITGTGFGATKEEAENRAKAEIKKIFDASAVADMPVVADINRHTFIEETWKDKNLNGYYAIAALERKVAKSMLQGSLDAMDAQIGGLVSQFNTRTDKFARIKTALKLQPLIIQRNGMEDLYETVDYNGIGYDPQNFSSMKDVLYTAMGGIKISLNVLGQNSDILHTHIINSFNEMGLSVAKNEPADIAVDVTSEIVEYPSKRLQGLLWCSATSTVNLKDVSNGGIFATFSITDRQGSSTSTEAVKRTMDAIGKKSAQEIKTKMYDYLERR
ncbi:hypothetical protein Dip510_000914 [Elusimicrobium posterum]|uniref:hypothetical protein n=1 Tax=Elusimicrobium posterum TaxID=3116653 RepID=UPI003C7603CC